jgi:hypothetical protein
MALGLETCRPWKPIASESLTELGVARCNPPHAQKGQMRLVMQSLLAERFKLAVYCAASQRTRHITVHSITRLT